MTIQDLGNIGELIAAIATVATLVYLALQIRANTVAVRSESRGRIHTQSQTMGSVIGGSPQAADVFARGLADFDSLEPTEQMQFQFLFAMIESQADLSYHNFQLGLGGADWMEAMTAGVLELFETPGGARYWKLNGSKASPEFQNFVNQKLARTRKLHSAA